MNSRIEEKILISGKQLTEFKEYLYTKKSKNLFPKRIIESLYFDNIQKQMFLDSEEGCVPRKKIRLRNYDEEFIFAKNINKEIKISSVEGRYKISEKVRDLQELMNLGIYDQNYGLCLPVLNVIYKRSYYKIKNIRLTLDEKITYKRIVNREISKFSTFDNYNIVELKYNSEKSIGFVNQNFPFERARFSKYSRGIEFIRMNYCNEL